MGRLTLSGGGPVPADVLRRALGVLWIADALVKLALPFGERPGEQSYEQIMTAESGPPGFHHILAWEANLFVSHPFLWWLPAAVELGIGTWLVLRPASRRGLAVSAGWALVVWAADEGLDGLAAGGSLLADYPGAALLYAVAADGPGGVGGHAELRRHLHRLVHRRGHRPGLDHARPGVLAGFRKARPGRRGARARGHAELLAGDGERYHCPFCIKKRS